MPAVSDAREAAEIAGRIVARSPRLTNAATETERNTEAAALFELAERLRQALDRNVEYGYSDTELETLRATAERLRENLSAQNGLVAARIDATGRLADTIAQSLEAAQGLSDLSETLVSNAAAGTTAVISNLYELVEAEDRIEESLDALDRLYEEDVFLMERMFELRLRASQVGLLLNQLSRAGTDDEVAWIESALGANLRILERRVGGISDPVRLRQAPGAAADVARHQRRRPGQPVRSPSAGARARCRDRNPHRPQSRALRVARRLHRGACRGVATARRERGGGSNGGRGRRARHPAPPDGGDARGGGTDHVALRAAQRHRTAQGARPGHAEARARRPRRGGAYQRQRRAVRNGGNGEGLPGAGGDQARAGAGTRANGSGAPAAQERARGAGGGTHRAALRCQRPAAGRGRQPRPGKGASRDREPGEERIPRGHEPRDSHPDERHPRHAAHRRRQRALGRPAGEARRHPVIEPDPARHPQRHPRLFEDRDRGDSPGAAGFRSAPARRGHPGPDAVPGDREWARSPDPDCRRCARLRPGRFRQAQPDTAQSDRQRTQVHRAGAGCPQDHEGASARRW